jgi:hypothetical protein
VWTVLVIAQERIEVEVSLKRDGRWSREVLTDFDAELALPDQGFRCSVGDLYRNTPLRPRPARHP